MHVCISFCNFHSFATKYNVLLCLRITYHLLPCSDEKTSTGTCNALLTNGTRTPSNIEVHTFCRCIGLHHALPDLAGCHSTSVMDVTNGSMKNVQETIPASACVEAEEEKIVVQQCV